MPPRKKKKTGKKRPMLDLTPPKKKKKNNVWLTLQGKPKRLSPFLKRKQATPRHSMGKEKLKLCLQNRVSGEKKKGEQGGGRKQMSEKGGEKSPAEKIGKKKESQKSLFLPYPRGLNLGKRRGSSAQKGPFPSSIGFWASGKIGSLCDLGIL